MKTVRLVCTFMLCLLVLSGCEWIDAAIQEIAAKAIKAQNDEIAHLRARLDEVSQNLDQARKDISRLDFTEKAYRDNYKASAAILGSASTGYSVARTSLGAAVVSLQEITPYMEGFKVRLFITFLVPIEVSGLKGTLSWIETDPVILKKNSNTLREKEFVSTASFVGGRYTAVEVLVTPASAAGLKEFYIRLTTDQINVSRPLTTAR